MTGLDLDAQVLAWMISYGAPIVGGMLLVGALGVPLPGTVIVIAAGAFIRQQLLDAVDTPLIALLCVVSGDIIIYSIGRFARVWIERRFGDSASVQRARRNFTRRGGIAIYLSRWLLTPLAVPTNLIAGSSGYPFPKLFIYDLAGEVTWIGLYGGLGYVFASQWELISDLITGFSGLLLAALAIVAGIYLIVRIWPHTSRVISRRQQDHER